MRVQFAVLAVLAFAAAAFSQTAIQPADWSATANAVSMQTSGKSLVFHVKDVAQAVRVSILDLKGRSVWSRTTAPVDGAVSIAWDGSTGSASAVRGVYVARVEAVGSARAVLAERQFVHAP